jgi:hypothetical protein
MLTKPLDQITATDISDLCAQGGVHESLTIEFKRELQSRDGKRPDAWMTGGDTFSDFARDRLFREIVAFANAQGGTLVLGIEEIGGNPPRAGAVMPLPRADDLAARLEDAARACIEPPLGGLQVRGIVTDQATGAGVVLFRTLASPHGPHRVAGDGHAFIRRGTSSVKMTMREIQDLTLDLARGAARLDGIFQQRATGFHDWFHQAILGRAHGVRVTAVPLSKLPSALRVARLTDGGHFEERFSARFEGSEEEQTLLAPLRGATTRPILRGCRAAHRYEQTLAVELDILDQGIVDLWWWHAPEKETPSLYLGWILGSVHLVLKLVNWVRERTDTPEWQYGLELEVAGLAATGAAVATPRNPLEAVPIQRMGRFADTIDVPPVVFPRLSWQSSDEQEEILNLVMRDILDSGGVRQPAPRITVLAAALFK